MRKSTQLRSLAIMHTFTSTELRDLFCVAQDNVSYVSQSKQYMASLKMLEICGRGSELFIHRYIHEFLVCDILLNCHAKLHRLLDSKYEMTYTELRDYISHCVFVWLLCTMVLLLS